MAETGRPQVLDGVRILELARWQAAPRGGMVLRDMGAEVIKVEWSKGSDLRNSGPFVGKMSVQFAAYNRGKKSITLNTRQQKGKEIFLDLVRQSDVVLENFRPGTIDDMGFSYEAMKQVNPSIILASVSGFGQYGPYRDRQCFDPIIQAMSGIGHQTGRGFDQPVMAEGPIACDPIRSCWEPSSSKTGRRRARPSIRFTVNLRSSIARFAATRRQTRAGVFIASAHRSV